jgi:hypothetical protein
MKPVLNFKIDLDKVSPDVAHRFAIFLIEKLGNEYYVAITPCNLTNPTMDAVVHNFDGIDYTPDEIVEFLKH